jgi:lysophospholipase L1-like esterase
VDYRAPVQKIVFIGDSVTACHRNPVFPQGFGYVRVISKKLPSNWTVINKGINGDRLIDLERRWDEDILEHAADFVSIAIGVNDTWRRFDKDDPSAEQDFAHRYARLISIASKSFGTNIVLCEPFVLPLNARMQKWREDLEGKLSVIRRLAIEFNLLLVPFDAEMGYLAQQYKAEFIAKDGIHPTKFGHSKMAEIWLSTFTRGIRGTEHSP